ncbi:MAG: Fic family protein [Phenylobacterium sp.]|uniref:Fic family protein n=1 Tax=Phenylobacterium sp. TaxID=1871053 RepID=UPI001B6C36F2|nr:Fic family protein [Phenylobacterium sp.]MBP7649418.1 Fic family protein [Phenylobacterium sp.]MBP7817140.1 Fic family protein [Phenylobacterium sp.]
MRTYIHERPDWPTFTWSHVQLAAQLGSVRHHQGRLIGRMEGLGFQLRAEAVLQSLTEEVLKSSEIEGEVLDRDQVRSSLARRLGMDIGALTPVDRDVEGVVEMMLDATQNYAAPLTKERLLAWHAALFPTGRSGMNKITVGAWRTAESGPMQVVSGPVGRERVHFEAPHADVLDREMRTFLAWFNAKEAIDPVLVAAVAHLWFVTIHPFEDGNGRIGRAIADMALARSEGSPRRFYSLSAQIRVERKPYYDHLEAAQHGDLDITAWIAWFLGCLDRAFAGSESILASVLRKAHFWEAHTGAPLNDRQRTVVNRLLNGFEGKLTSSKYAALAKCSQDTASRDIDDLIDCGVLAKDPGGGRSTSYVLIVTAGDALETVARYVRLHADKTVRDGAGLLSPDETLARRRAVEALADRMEVLAKAEEPPRYADFEVLLRELHGSGFHPDERLVAAVAQTIRRGL